jgi:thioredoxin reductase (NADPH)
MQIDAEVAIIGAGPIGIEIAIALNKSRISFIQFDKGQIAQTIYEFPVQTHFFSSLERLAIAGIPIQTVDQQKCTREEYLAYLRSCVIEYQLTINTFEEVIDIQKNISLNLFEIDTIKLGRKKLYRTTYVVLSTGGTAHSRMLKVPGENLPHVSSTMVDPHHYFQKQVAIIGSRNSAVEWALRCFHVGAHVTLISRKDSFDEEHVKYWLLPELKGLVKDRLINCVFGAKILEIFPDKVRFLLNNGEISEVFAEFVIKAIGFFSDISLFKIMGVHVSENDIPSFNLETMETNIENAFVMGTAIGGTQVHFKVFIENCHEHVNKIVETIGKRMGKELEMNRNIFPRQSASEQ